MMPAEKLSLQTGYNELQNTIQLNLIPGIYGLYHYAQRQGVYQGKLIKV